ncbi:MAG: hypothetical protein GY790_08630 [Bacteroidetes bacterium]|nr:hypothetical protein [Bacteroidota bacterium]
MEFIRLKSHSKSWVLIFIFFAFTVIFLGSCEKSEGMGGTASISGAIIEHFYNDDFSDLIRTSPAIDEEVFVIFGNDYTPGERVNTGSSGDFRFDYLYPGIYHVYYRTLDSTKTPDDEWAVIRVDLERGEEADLGAVEKATILEYDEGSAVISGVVRKIKYDNDSKWPKLVIEYIDFAHEHEVYLTYGDHSFYDERVRTQDDGYFEFKNLIPGEYRIFLYSEDVTKVTEHVVLEFEESITEFEQEVDLGLITIKAI